MIILFEFSARSAYESSIITLKNGNYFVEIGKENSLLLNKTNAATLIGCLLIGFLPVLQNIFVSIYYLVKYLFPFSTISAHAALAVNSKAVIAQLTYVWLIFPVYVPWLIFQSQKVCYIKDASNPEKRAVIISALLIGLLAPAFGLLYATSEPSLCKGCEYGNQVTGGFIRIGLLWLFGFMFGQAVVFISKRKIEEI